MIKKVLYLTAGIALLWAKDGHCDPVSALTTVGSFLSGVGASLGPAGVLAGGALGIETLSAVNQPKKPNEPNQPNLPDPNAAADSAQAEITKSRRALLLSGGETTLTGAGGSPLLGVNIATKSLLGGG